MNIKGTLPALGLAVLLAGAAHAEDRTLEGQADAKGIQTLRLDSHVGSIEIVVKDVEKISWKVRLEPDNNDGWFSSRKDAQAAIDGAKVRAAAAGDVWELEVEPPKGADLDDVKEHWTVEVPARFAVRLDSNVGEIRVTGPAGGVEVELNVGEIRLELPKGGVEARLNVGEIRVINATRSLGRVELQANVGDVNLTVDGKRTESTGLFVGGKIRTDGNKGDDEISARVNVGEVRVTVGE